MSIFNPGTTVDMNELRNKFNAYYPTDTVDFSILNNHYYNPQNNLGWYQNKDFRRIKIYNAFIDVALSNPATDPRVGLSQPFVQYTQRTDGISISPKLISHNDYTVTLAADTPYGWSWQGWYSGNDGGGILLSSGSITSLTSTSHTGQYEWWGYHITSSKGGGGLVPKCLDGNSNILMADGTYKKVKDLETGELLKSKAVSDKPNTGYQNDWEAYVNWNDLNAIPTLEDSNSMVDDVFEIEAKYLKVINNGLLKMALTHPVLVKKLLASGETGWTVRGAFNIEEGDIILGDNGEEINVTSVEVQEGDFTLYDLYVVGNDTIHVNNVILPVNVV